MTKRILVADDEENLLNFIRSYLEESGYDVVTATNGREALYAARYSKPDLIVLDLMMPELDGYEFMRLHRKENTTPIIMLTARVEEDDRILGLELGADDYVTKPFSARELVARINAVLRRSGDSNDQPKILRAGQLEVDCDGYYVSLAGEELNLTRTEFDLLAYMMTTPGKAFSRMQLLEAIQEDAFAGYERTVDVHIKNLRAKLESDPKNPEYIETVYGVGYRFAAGNR